ncbi:MAG: carboxypeptidase regulatory-like domain-containing protein [Anaerolineales bacterium]|jgi:hypothetical protein
MNHGTSTFSSQRLALILLVTLIVFISASVALASSSSPMAQPELSSAETIDSVTCSEGIVNGGFEDRTAWKLTATQYTASYVSDPEPVRSGDWSMRTGIVDPADNRYSYSSVIQAVKIPTGTEYINLKFWIYPQTGEDESIPLYLPRNPLGIEEEDAANVSDWQFVFILNAYGQELERLLYRRQDADEWQYHSFDLSHHKNQGTIQIYFDTFNNGVSKITSMHIDDVSMDICDGPPPPELNGTISGTIVLQGRTDHSNAEVCADDGGAPVCTQSDATGAYSMDVTAGSYEVTVTKERYLDAEKLNVPVIAGSTTTLVPVTLLGGDTNDDCDVNILDLALVGGRFSLSCGDSGWDERADINDDCTVNILDLSLVGGNFGKSCPVPWS